MSPNTTDWMEIRNYIKEAEGKLIKEFLEDLEDWKIGSRIFRPDIIKKWETRRKE